MEQRLSHNFAMDKGTFYTAFDGFYCSHADLAATLPGTRVNAVALTLAEKPWADPHESLRAVQTACAVIGIHDRFDWIATETRCRARRNAAITVDRVWRAALSGKPLKSHQATGV